MNLSAEDAKLYYELMLPLQFYAGRKAGILKGCPDVAAYKDLAGEAKRKTRNALFEHREWIGQYCDENPDGRSLEELTLLRGWRHAVTGTFTLERILAKHGIFIDDGKHPTVYAAVGLMTPLDEMFPREALPVMLEAVLIPFKGRIALDGLFSLYNVRLGAGYKGDYREIYLRAKQNGRIVERLEGDPWKDPSRSEAPAAERASTKPRRAGRPKKEQPDPVSLLNTVEAELERLAPRPTGSPAQKAAFALLKESILMAKSSTLGYDMPGVLTVQWDSYNRVVKEVRKIWRILKRASPTED